MESLIIRIRGVDMLDSTPLIDIKPYIPESDSISKAKIGWLSNLNLFCF
ncbi:MAG: TrmO family methyltransferase [Caldisericia bacterium]|nr:TrmO family methyltransferase [Caldisericia bacterium]